MTTKGHGGGKFLDISYICPDRPLRADSGLSFTSLRPDLGMVAYRTPTRGAFYFVPNNRVL
jgi:hypothetical protein